MSLVVYRINWFRVVCDLNRAGWTDRRIAKEIGVSGVSISYYKQGREPLHHNGEKLLTLHRKYCLSPEPPSREPIRA